MSLALVLMSAPRLHAFGCQASGSLPIFPATGTTCPIALHLGDLVDIQVTAQNTASSVPAGTNVTAKLVNVCIGGVNSGAPCTVPGECGSAVCGAAIVYTLACTNTTCSTELPGTLTFVPVGVNGCVSNVPAVTGCALNLGDLTNNKVDITVNAAGVPLPAGSNVPVAVLRAQVTAEIPFSLLNPCGQFGTRADTSGNSLVTTDVRCDAAATGGAQGSSNLYLAQPTATPTPTPTPTPTATPTPTPALRSLNHFQCYETHRPPARIFGITLDDQFGPGVVDLKKLKRICAPADKNGEDPTAPSDPDHLGVYTIKQTSPHFRPIKGVIVNNQFGEQVMNLVKPDRLLVPTAKSLTTPLSELPTDFGVDHFKCYKVAFTKLRKYGIIVHDQFGVISVDIRKPTHLCVPADKNGEGIPDLTQNLMCYKVVISPGTPAAQLPSMIFTIDQFGADSFSFFGPRELCVPSTKTLP